MFKGEGYPAVVPPAFCKGDAVYLVVSDRDGPVPGEVMDRGRRSTQWGQADWVYLCIREDTRDVDWYFADNVWRREHD